MDGLTSIFTSFFIPNNFYSIPSTTTLAVCKDAMNAKNCPECALFLCNYLALLISYCPEDVTSSFYNEDGFTCLNNFLVTYCDKSIAKECYQILLLKKGKPTRSTLRGLYEAYISVSDYQEFSLEILRNLKPIEIQSFVPIHAWVLNEKDMKEESFHHGRNIGPPW